MGLQGDLTSFDAADVLRLLSWTKKSGTLDLSGDRGHGLVRVLNGKVVGGAVDGARTGTDAEVVYELLRFRIGTFLFEDGEPKADRKAASVDDVLAGAATLLSEWKAIESVVPDFDRSLRLVPDVAGEEVRLSADEWRAIVRLGGGGTVRQLGDRLEVSDLAVGATVKGLIERGMVALDELKAEPVDEPEADDEPELLADPDPDPALVADLPGFGPSAEVDDRGAGGDTPPDGGVPTAPAQDPDPSGLGDRDRIRFDYEPGLDGAPTSRRPSPAFAPRGVVPRPATTEGPAAPSTSRDAVESGRATERRPYVDLGAVRQPAGPPVSPAPRAPSSTPPPPPPPPPPPGIGPTTGEVEATSAAAPTGEVEATPAAAPAGEASWEPAWAQTVGRDIPTVGETSESTDPDDRKKGRRLFRRS